MPLGALSGLWAALLCAAALALAGCDDAPDQPEPSPALWQIAGAEGQRAYLFGTVHALPDGVRWRTPQIDHAFDAADMLVVEISLLDAEDSMRAAFQRLSATSGQPPLAMRVSPEDRALVSRVMAEHGLKDADFANMETWAAALVLSQLAEGVDSANGVDRALLKAAGNMRVIELEGAERQLGLFDALPEQEQDDLLEGVARELDEAGHENELDPRLEAWLTGDLAALEEAARGGLLADPELREALLVGRNRDWAERIDALLSDGATPFIAVGAAHLLGPDGLVALLNSRGYSVERVR